MLNAQPGIPDRVGITYETAFVGAGMRRHPRLNYIPSRLSLVPVLFRDHFVPNVVMLNTSRMRDGKLSLGTEVNILPAAIEAARATGGIVVAQANSRMPYTFGDSELDESLIDYVLEVDEELTEKPLAATNDAAQVIAGRVADMLSDGSTLQLGIGAIPDAVVARLIEKRNLRVWSEMFSDGVLALSRANALDTTRPITASFIFGGRALYDWVNLNDSIEMRRTETTNDPANISRQQRMTSINSALQVDLYDQANASHVNGRIYSGFGGSTDFIVGALHALGGKSIMALQSWHPKAKTSTIVPRLTEYVTSFQHSHVITEQGVADCFGHTEHEQATSLIERAAHPDARAELRVAATNLGLI
jgi:acyl-CoA hydrolase